MIVVTGAGGQLGSAVVSELSKRVRVEQIAASVREPEKAASLRELGATIRIGDFGNPSELAAAFEGADQVLVISVNMLGERARQLHKNAFDAAKKAGAKRILYTSHMGARKNSPFAPAADHAAAEEYLNSHGIDYVSLRHGFYAESALHMIGDGIKAGEIRAPEDGPVSWTARADLAEADAIVLADGGLVEKISSPLTAAEAITLDEIAMIASEVSGREIRRVTLKDDDWIQEKVAKGLPEQVARMLIGSYQASRRGDFEIADTALGKLLGREPRTMRQILTDYLNT